MNNSLEIAIELGEMCREIKSKVRTFLDNIESDSVKLIDIVKFIENQITQKFRGNNKNNNIAFPVGVGVNNVCAHDTCYSDSDDRRFNLNLDLIKIDFGIQKDGIIIDNAFTYSRNINDTNLVNVSKYIVDKVIKNIKKDSVICDIQSLADRSLNEFNRENNTNFVAVSNLAGHQIKRNLIHADDKQLIYPNNLVNKNESLIQGDSFYAIEFFISDGINKFPDMVVENITHFMVKPNKLKKLEKMDIYNKPFHNIRIIILEYFGTLPFCQRFIQERINVSTTEIDEFLNYLFQIGVINEYPAIIDNKGPNVKVSQHEETIYVPSDLSQNVVVLS